MIDALKDKIAANPSEYGLTNIDHLNIGQQLDLSHLFEGPDATQLESLHQGAAGLDQGAVDSILKHNEIIRDWVADHPLEALDGPTVDRILSGELPAAVSTSQSGE